MSEVKRYRLDPESCAAEHPQGDLVDYHEYARLKAEVERLTALVESNLNSSKVAIGKADAVLHERDNLKAEVERLRKAGDEMEKVIILAECIAGVEHTEKSAIAWNAAKEGKQS